MGLSNEEELNLVGEQRYNTNKHLIVTLVNLKAAQEGNKVLTRYHK